MGRRRGRSTRLTLEKRGPRASATGCVRDGVWLMEGPKLRCPCRKRPSQHLHVLEFAHAGFSASALYNGSTDCVPRYWEEYVRKMFVSSAAMLNEEFHVDGFRVDLTQAMHADCRLNSTHELVPSANAFGGKLLREWTRTLKAVGPSLFLIAEEHKARVQITQPVDSGGFGFDATWFVDM